MDSAVSHILPRLRVDEDGSFFYEVPGSPYYTSLKYEGARKVPMRRGIMTVFVTVYPTFPVPRIADFPFF